ncbi:MAG TPA: pyridoxamine 5'-phosphate oxidase family protein [Pyrinomonadaceae bacterium]|jgi:hypothetical protein
MLRVEEMSAEEARDLLRGARFGHLACAHENRPYVVPMNYAYDGEAVYFFTTEGTKTGYIEGNPEVCLQVEDVRDAHHWRSVIVRGRAERMREGQGMERAMQIITQSNPALAPAIEITRADDNSPHAVAVYRIRPDSIDGRKTAAE